MSTPRGPPAVTAASTSQASQQRLGLASDGDMPQMGILILAVPSGGCSEVQVGPHWPPGEPPSREGLSLESPRAASFTRVGDHLQGKGKPLTTERQGPSSVALNGSEKQSSALSPLRVGADKCPPLPSWVMERESYRQGNPKSSTEKEEAAQVIRKTSDHHVP